MIDLSSIKGAIFDADGTLFDSMWMWLQVESDYLKSLAVLPREDQVEALRPLSHSETAEYFRSEYGMNKTVQEITNEKNAMMEHFYFSEVQLKPGVIPVLEALYVRGVKMCVATATDRHLIEPPLRNTGILRYFERIFTCGEENTSKKKPEIFIRAASFLETDIKETIVVEDAFHAIISAKRAGFPVIGVYDRSAGLFHDEIREQSDYYFTVLDEMLELL